MRAFSTLGATIASLVLAAAVHGGAVDPITLEARADIPKLVFAHFMIGIESNRHAVTDYDFDMQRAKEYGIDAYALNIGTDPYTDEQLGLAYASAAKFGVKVFISFDFNWWSTGQAAAIGQKIAQYGSLPAQLKIGNAAFVSSFAGDGLDVAAVRANTGGLPIYLVPNFQNPSQGSFSQLDGAFNWMAWPNNGRNKAPNGWGNFTVEQGDQVYLSALAGKPYMAPVSPWFFTHYGPEVPYSKNWVFPGDLLWFNRWKNILNLAPQFIEIVTWNDYGESHYIGPLSSSHQDDGGSKWVNDMPHNGWLDLAKPFIKAFKAGAKAVDAYIESDQIIYWYRPTLRTLNCDATDTTMVAANNASGNYFIGRPDGWQTLLDEVFVVTLLKSPGSLTVNSGSNTRTFTAPAGAAAFTVPLAVGRQSFALARNGQNVLAGVSLRDVSDVCPCGLYNFNAFVGALPPTFIDPMGPAALASLTQGLHVATCAPTPSLGTSAPAYTGPGGQPTSNPGTTSVSTPTSIPSSSATFSSTTTGPTSGPTTPPTSTRSASTTSGTGCTVTDSAQIRPTNCLQPGCIWAGPPGQDDPDYC